MGCRRRKTAAGDGQRREYRWQKLRAGGTQHGAAAAGRRSDCHRPGNADRLRHIVSVSVRSCRQRLTDVPACVGFGIHSPEQAAEVARVAKTVDAYGEKARFETPLENPYVLELLKRLGFDTVEELLSDQELFTRSF